MSVRSVVSTPRTSVRIVFLAISCLAVAGCSTWGMGYAGKKSPAPSSDHLEKVSHPRAVVRMQPDQSLEITTLVSRRGSAIPALRIVTPDDPAYARILELTGPLTPGRQASGYLPAE